MPNSVIPSVPSRNISSIQLLTSKKTLITALLTMTLVLLAACNSGSSSSSSATDDDDSDDTVAEFTVGGSISGLGDGEITLQLNGDESLVLDSDGNFSFPTALDDDSAFDVQISVQPGANLICAVANGSGVLDGSDVTSVSVNCDVLALQVDSDFGQVTFDWDYDGHVDILYSTDMNCNWDNYTTCDQPGDMVSQVAKGESLDLSDGLTVNQQFFFVAEAEGARSEVVAGSPWSIGVAGTVNTSLIHDGIWYMGGEDLQPAPATGPGAILDPETGRHLGAIQSVAGGNVNVAVSDGSGGWFIGGSFDSIAGQSRDNLARIRADGSLHPEWEAGVNGEVSSIVVFDDQVVVGGYFTEDNAGVSRKQLASFNLETGDLKDWNPGVVGADDPTDQAYVYSLVAIENDLIVGGDFSSIGGGDGEAVDRAYLAKVSMDSVATVRDWDTGLEIDDDSYPFIGSLLHYDGVIYVGGNFETPEDPEDGRKNLLAVAAETGEILDWAPEIAGRIEDLAQVDGIIAVGGTFDTIASNSRNGLALFSPVELSTDGAGELVETGGDILDWSAELLTAGGGAGSVNSLWAEGSSLYVGGGYSSAESNSRTRLAAFDLNSTEDVVLLEWNPGTNSAPRTLAGSEGLLYVGGSFDYTGNAGVPVSGAVAFELSSGTLKDMHPEFDGPVHALETLNDQLFVGGEFSEVEGQARESLAAFNLASGDLEDWSPGIRKGGDEGLVRALAAHSGILYVGGDFDQATSSVADGGYSTRNNAAAFATGSSSERQDWNPDTNEPVLALMIADSTDPSVLLAGQFTTVDGGTGRDLFAAWDINDESWVDDTPGFTGSGAEIRFLDIADNTLYLAGDFSQVDGVGRDKTAALNLDTLDLESWAAATSLNNGFDGGMAVGEESVYFGFSSSTSQLGAVRTGGAAFEKTGDFGLRNWNPSANGTELINTLLVHDGKVYVAGDFVTIGGGISIGAAILEPTGEGNLAD